MNLNFKIMNTYTDNIRTKLNALLEKTKDAEKGFRTAAENTDHTYLKSYFEKKSRERYNFGLDLNSEMTSFGERGDTTGSVVGTAHRAWMDIKALFSADSAESMLQEAITGESAALEEYKNVLNETSLPISTHSLLLKQMDAIENELNTIKKLEDLH